MRTPALAVFVLSSVLCAGALSACAPMTTQDAGVAKCDTARLGWAIGQPATEENARRLLRESGMGLWRIIAPETVAKKDYRPDRLTIRTDKDNIIQSFECN